MARPLTLPPSPALPTESGEQCSLLSVEGASGRGVSSAVLLSLTLHGVLLALGLHLLSYDAHIHTFFASHYLRRPFDLWEPRFYAGFSVASYPPLVHQTMALVAAVAGLDAAFPVVLLLTAAALPVALYVWGRIWVGQEAAAFGALVGVMLPSVGLAAFAFGQLAQLAGMTLALFTLAALAAYLRRGGPLRLALTAALVGITAAAHHLNAVLLLPLAGAAVTAGALLAGNTPRWTTLRRALLAAMLAGVAAVLTVLPFWLWLLGYEQQAPIDHASRHNFLTDQEARKWFLWPMYGSWPVALLANLPDLCNRRRVVLIGLVGLLALIGLGGTTPLPWLLYGSWADWLTFDRFAMWAGAAAAPLLGQTLATFVTSPLGPLSHEEKGSPLSAGGRQWRLAVARMRSLRRAVFALTLALGVLAFLWAGTLSIAHPTQPPLMDVGPAARFLAEGDHARWRYLTLGFGDQLARLAAVTDAASIDGNYHTARWLPALRASGIGSLDGTLWWDREARTLRAVLRPELGDRLLLRWVLVYNTADYDGLLREEGLAPVRELENGVMVWERRPSPDPFPRPEEQGALPSLPSHWGRGWGEGAARWWLAAPWTAVAVAAACAGALYSGDRQRGRDRSAA